MACFICIPELLFQVPNYGIVSLENTHPRGEGRDGHGHTGLQAPWPGWSTCSPAACAPLGAAIRSWSWRGASRPRWSRAASAASWQSALAGWPLAVGRWPLPLAIGRWASAKLPFLRHCLETTRTRKSTQQVREPLGALGHVRRRPPPAQLHCNNLNEVLKHGT